MNRLPCELLQHILWYIDQPSDLFRMSCVCRHWRSSLKNDECFLNQWFSRSLNYSQEPYYMIRSHNMTSCTRPPMLNIDQSLFPLNLRASECCLLPDIIRPRSTHYNRRFKHYFPLSFFDLPHSFSFWIYLPRQYELNIQIGHYNVDSLVISLYGFKNIHFDNGKLGSIADRWVHMVLTKVDSQCNYQIWIDGQSVSKLNQYPLFSREFQRIFSLISFELLRRCDNDSLEASNKCCITNLIAFNRCLTLVEIRAIYQQETSISQVKVGTYIHTNKYIV